MEYVYLAIFILFIITIIITVFIPSKKQKWVDQEEFQRWKEKINLHITEEEFEKFFTFLKKYGGGYVRRRNGQIVYQDFLGKEKGDLKGIFFNVVIPSPKISVDSKEQFRQFLIGIGVRDIQNRPKYEQRSGKLSTRGKDEEEVRRKRVGNKGEILVRDYLKKLDQDDYYVINGVVLQIESSTKEFDHIILGRTGVFVIETKAFGMSDEPDGVDKARLFIDKGDIWKLNKYGQTRTLKCPTEQIVEEKRLLEDLLKDFAVEVCPILLLSNGELSVKQNIELPYKVLKLGESLDYIMNYHEGISQSDRLQMISIINKSRRN